MKITSTIRQVQQRVVVVKDPLTLGNFERALVGGDAYRTNGGLRRTVLHYAVDDCADARAIREEFGSSIRIKPCIKAAPGTWAVEVLRDLDSEETLFDLANPFRGE